MISQYFYIDCIRDDTEFHTAVVLFEQSNCVGCIFIFAIYGHWPTLYLSGTPFAYLTR
jgi:hypothetical protein